MNYLWRLEGDHFNGLDKVFGKFGNRSLTTDCLWVTIGRVNNEVIAPWPRLFLLFPCFIGHPYLHGI